MARIEKLIEVEASEKKLWPLLLWERMPEWFTPFKKVEYTSKIKNKVGETVRITTEEGQMDAKTTEMKENEKVAWRYTSKAFTGLEIFVLTPTKDGAGVLVSDILEYEIPDMILGITVDKPRFHSALDASIDVCLQKLKALAEK